MSLKKDFESIFSEVNLTKGFDEYISLSGGSGVDNLSIKAFQSQKEDQIEIVSRKALNGTYEFSKYKQKLISKGAGKAPREISIPTARDRIALRALSDFLNKRYKGTVKNKLPQDVIKSLKAAINIGDYDGFIKLDVQKFYPSIKHDELFKRLRGKIRFSPALSIIESAISSATVSSPSKHDKPNKKGVPQGLAVSNVLASIYMKNIDSYYEAKTGITYFRYVDDILILCDHSQANEIAKEIIRRFNRIGLKVHEPLKGADKSTIGVLGEPFSYLGYYFEGDKVSVRTGSVERLKSSLAAIFTSFKYSRIKDEDFLLWRLDTRITGCIFEEKSKGWLFFFSQINDESLLHQLDIYVEKLVERFKVKIKPKKFVRAFKELSHNKHSTKYIPNFDAYSTKEKHDLLLKYFPRDVAGKTLNDQQIDFYFKRRISKQIRDMLEDIKSFRS